MEKSTAANHTKGGKYIFRKPKEIKDIFFFIFGFNIFCLVLKQNFGFNIFCLALLKQF